MKTLILKALMMVWLMPAFSSYVCADEIQRGSEMDVKTMGEAMASAFLKPLPQPFEKTPEDYGMRYRDVEFKTRDGLTLRGWLVGEDADKVVIMTHFGYRANRYGYQLKHQPADSKPYDKEIEFGKVAKRLVDAGYAVLMYDLRNHGESDKTELGVGTGGDNERFDVIAAVEYVANESATAGKPIGLLSYCYGANTSFFAMEEDQSVFKNAGVKAMVALQPLSNGDYLKSLGVSDAVYQAAEKSYRARSGGYPLVAPIERAAKSTVVPTRLVQARQDPNTNFSFIAELYKNMPVKKEMFWLEEPTHRFDGYNWFAEHPRDMLDWFDMHMAAR
ncbi:MAG: alpha/beta fold hydrolase [Pseudomonadota bacterium]